jgi:hypothetical protein
MIMKWLEWVEDVHVDARVAYLLTLIERNLHKIENYEWYPLVRDAIDMCWEWIEEKKYSGEDLYEILDNEDEEGLIYIEGVAYGENPYGPQARLVWSCVVDAICYTAWKAYQYENETSMPQPIRMVNDKYIDDEFMEKIKKIEGYQESLAERLKQYLLEHYSLASSDRKIKRSEIVSRI